MSDDDPLQERVGRIIVWVMLEDSLNASPDDQRLLGVADQIAHDSDSIGAGQFHPGVSLIFA